VCYRYTVSCVCVQKGGCVHEGKAYAINAFYYRGSNECRKCTCIVSVININVMFHRTSCMFAFIIVAIPEFNFCYYSIQNGEWDECPCQCTEKPRCRCCRQGMII